MKPSANPTIMPIMSNELASAEPPAIPALTHDTWSEGLDDKEVAFVLAYTEGVTARKPKAAALKAGYAQTTAMVASYGWISKNSSKPKVRAAVEFIFAEKYAAGRMSADEVLARLEGLARSDIRQVVKFYPSKVVEADEDAGEGGDVVTIREVHSNTVEVIASDELDDEAAATIKGIKQDKDGNVSIIQHDKVAALALLARHHGLADDRVRHLGPRGGPVEVLQISVDMTADQAASAWRATIDADG